MGWNRIPEFNGHPLKDYLPQHGRNVLVRYDDGIIGLTRRWSMQRIDKEALMEFEETGVMPPDILGDFICGSNGEHGKVVAWRELMEWIKVTDQMPEDDTPIIVCVASKWSHGATKPELFPVFAKKINGEFFLYDTDDSMNEDKFSLSLSCFGFVVTHWMLPPDPPSEPVMFPEREEHVISDEEMESARKASESYFAKWARDMGRRMKHTENFEEI